MLNNRPSNGNNTESTTHLPENPSQENPSHTVPVKLESLRTFEAFTLAEKAVNISEEISKEQQQAMHNEFIDLLNLLRLNIPHEFLELNLVEHNTIARGEITEYGIAIENHISQRDLDVWHMLDRINNWYTHHEAQITKTEYQAAFDILQNYFLLIASAHDFAIAGGASSINEDYFSVAKPDTFKTPPRSSSIHRSSISSLVSAEEKIGIDAIKMEERDNNAKTSTTYYVADTSCWEVLGINHCLRNSYSTLLYSCAYTINIWGQKLESNQHPKQAITRQTVFFKKENNTSDQINNQINSELNTWCGENFGYTFAGACCIGYQLTQGKIAAQSKLERPKNLFASCQYDITNHQPYCFKFLTNCLSQTTAYCFAAPSQISQACDAFFRSEFYYEIYAGAEKLTQIICQAIGNLENIAERMESLFESVSKITECFQNAFSLCKNISSLKELIKYTTLMGLTASATWSAIVSKEQTGNSNAADQARRYLLGETNTKKFLPSTIIMAISLITLGPRDQVLKLL